MKKCVPGLLFFLLALPFISLGQDNEKVIIEGRVVDADSLQPLPYVNVRAKNTNLGAATAADGRFNIRVNAQDSIVFSIVGYDSFLIVPKDSTAESLQHLVIKMVPRTYVLKEVKVKDYRDLTKYLQPKIDSTVDLRRPQNIRLFEEKEPQKKNTVHTVIPPGMQPAQLAGAVTAFANLFNDEYQQTKKLNKILEIEEEAEREQQIKEVMTEKFQAMVSVVADLDNAALQQFTTSYMPSPYLMLEMNDYEIMEGIMQHITAFEIAREKERISLEQKLKNAVFEDRDKIE
jgi:hypothetical protein